MTIYKINCPGSIEVQMQWGVRDDDGYIIASFQEKDDALMFAEEYQNSEQYSGPAATVKDPVGPVGVVVRALRREAKIWQLEVQTTDVLERQKFNAIGAEIAESFADAIEAEAKKIIDASRKTVPAGEARR